MSEFRPVIEADLNTIISFPKTATELFYFCPSAQFPLTIQALRKQINKAERSIVMLQHNRLVGFANFLLSENHPIAFIGNVIIDPQQRHKGLGTELMGYLIELGFNELNLKEIHVSCYQENAPAMHFYQQLGFNAYQSESRIDASNKTDTLIHLHLKNNFYLVAD